MKTTRADFTIKTNGSTIEAIGRTSIETPEIKWNGKGIRWFDDSVLIKKKATA